MSESLGAKQRRFTYYVALLIQEAYARGYELTFGEAWRTPEQAKLNATKGSGISNSLHLDRLAIDLNLFKDGKFLTTTEDHRPLGEWWEKLDPLCRWGGRFNDGNHYSLTHEGRA
jgi:hypothetical protein